MRCSFFAFLLSYSFLLSSCGLDAQAWFAPSYPYNDSLVQVAMDSVSHRDEGAMYADRYSRKLYNHKEGVLDTLYWVNRDGVDEKADVLMWWLATVEEQGLKSSSFSVDELARDLYDFRALKKDSCEEWEVCHLLGRLEYRLMRAYFRYAFGQRYGYVRVSDAFNAALQSDKADAYRHVFGMDYEQPTDSFAHVALSHLSSADALQDFLEEIQPTDSLFVRLCREYQRAQKAGETTRARLARVNIERSRWRYPRPASEGKYIWVNIPSFELLAVDAEQDEVLQMKVCVGQKKHQTPILASRIKRLELNPYWNVPYSIIKKEIAPAHSGDAAYFARNRMVAIEHATGAVLEASSLTEVQWRSGRYGLRQERGEGNSLGRCIFRFPNRFSVYLHDTNTPSAFSREVRAVSHGCVRVQKPLELALFMMDEPTPLFIDKLRIAIGRDPLTESGRQYQEETEEEAYMQNHYFKPSIPVFLDYYTLYPRPDGTLRAYKDVYGYDKAIRDALDAF